VVDEVKMNWFRKLFGLCQHQWDIHQKIDVYGMLNEYGQETKIPIRFDYILRCKHCGDMKKFKGK
jgi:hypothetical protein